MQAIYTLVCRTIRDLIQLVNGFPFLMDRNIHVHASRSSCTFLSSSGWGNIIFGAHT